jgi:intergrase/recombinase
MAVVALIFFSSSHFFKTEVKKNRSKKKPHKPFRLMRLSKFLTSPGVVSKELTETREKTVPALYAPVPGVFLTSVTVNRNNHEVILPSAPEIVNSFRKIKIVFFPISLL